MRHIFLFLGLQLGFNFTNGVTIQWGGLSIPNYSISLAFPTAFATNAYSLIILSSYGYSNIGNPLNIINSSGNINKAGCKLRASQINYAFWLAIGY